MFSCESETRRGARRFSTSTPGPDGHHSPRIIPLAMLVVVVIMVLERLTAGRSATEGLVDPAHWVVFFVFNFDHTAIEWEAYRPQPFSPYWSLAVEEQFSSSIQH